MFIEDLVFYICKGYLGALHYKKYMAKKFCFTPMSLSFISFQDYVYGFKCASCNGNFFFNLHVLQNLTFVTTIFESFDLWMSKGGVDIFSLVTIFLNESWTPMHVTMDLFEVNETSG